MPLEQEWLNDAIAPRRQADVRLPSPPPQLPAVLFRPGGQRGRDMDAERSPSLARPQPDPFGDCRRRPRRRKVRALHALRPLRRRLSRPARQPQSGDGDTVHPAPDRCLPGCALLDWGHHPRGDLRPRCLGRPRSDRRHAFAPVADLPARRTRRASERDRLELDAVQHRPHRRPFDRRGPDRRRRPRLVLRGERRLVPGRPRRALLDGPGRALPAQAPRAPVDVGRPPRWSTVRQREPAGPRRDRDDDRVRRPLLQLQCPAASAGQADPRRWAADLRRHLGGLRRRRPARRPGDGGPRESVLEGR